MARTSTILTIDEVLVLQAIADGTYFHSGEALTGTQDGVNDTFTLDAAPNPAASLILVINGMIQTPGGVDFTLVSDTITFVNAPFASDIIRAWYVVSPI